jgi:pimeloyl-ACP methyl ester carboxylesterase
VVTFDGRGNGRSDRPAAGYGEAEFAADALAVMDATATERAMIVSLSVGAGRALILAAGHPDRVTGAVFICPAVPLASPLEDRTRYPWDEVLPTDEGWAKDNLHYWLRDYRGFLEFFSQMFTEPHSTEPTKDCVGWAWRPPPRRDRIRWSPRRRSAPPCRLCPVSQDSGRLRAPHETTGAERPPSFGRRVAPRSPRR